MQSGYALSAFLLHHIFAVAGTLRVPLSQPQKRHIQQERWMNQEYLGLYRKIVRGQFKGQNEEVWMVWDETKNEAIELSKWISE
jgi:hypothetical protein